MKQRNYLTPSTRLFVTMICATVISAVHCGKAPSPPGSSATTTTVDPDSPSPALPFEAVAPASYVAKVKNLITGLPPSAEEVQKVTDDPGALAGLIDQWVDLPEAQSKLIAFFSNAFQQTQFVPDDFDDQLGNNADAPDLVVPALRESFGRTALELANKGRPFSETMTTRSFMMTTALMSFYSFVDVRRRDDKGNDRDKMNAADPTWSWTAVDKSVKDVPLTESIDPNSPNYMVWSVPNAKCMPRVYTKYKSTSLHLLILLFGTLPVGTAPEDCGYQTAVRDLPPFISDSDLSDWRMVEIRAPKPGEEKQRFFDLPALRKANELVVDIPRVGFFTTPAFFANWTTNVNNLARVTANQTLIVALGRSINPESATVPLSESGLDEAHADPSTACYGCHAGLDPLRQFFRRSLTVNYHEQLDPAEMASEPSFAFDGVTQAGKTLDDLAAILAQHPRLPEAWAQKLCAYADSAPCSADDPEFQRVVEAFRASGLKFRTLMRELFASPLVTGAAPTKTFQDRGVVVSIARLNHFCTALSNRLGIDACRLPMATRSVSTRAELLSSNLPDDGYSRGAENPDLITTPGLFVRSTTENLCKLVAQQVVDATPPGKYSSDNKEAAIDDFVASIMGLTSADARAAGAKQILEEHYAAVVQAGGSPTDALRSTFTLTCTSPLVSGIGL